MRRTAGEDGLQALVAPLRPTRKSKFPFVQMEDYIDWRQKQDSNSSVVTPGSNGVSKDSPRLIQDSKKQDAIPFDPWLRKHIRLGGKVVKVAPSSMYVRGSAAAWEAWTGVDFLNLLRKAPSKELKREPGSNQVYLEVPFQGGLVPLRLYVQEKTCVYSEPNVWLYHDVH